MILLFWPEMQYPALQAHQRRTRDQIGSWFLTLYPWVYHGWTSGWFRNLCRAPNKPTLRRLRAQKNHAAIPAAGSQSSTRGLTIDPVTMR